MAQHHPWILLLCLQIWPVTGGNDADSLVNGIIGESVTFELNIPKSQEVKSIAWISQSSVAFIVPEGQGKDPKVTVTHNNYEGRIKVIRENYNLVISDLRMEDEGKYRVDITATTTISKNYYLQIYRRLGKPKITQSLMTAVNGTCNVTLTCSVEKEEKNVSYSWDSLKTVGNVLHIVQTPGNQGLNYTCTARNPVSNSSISISSQQLCTDIAPDPHPRRTVLLTGLAIVIFGVLILFAVFLLHSRMRKQGAAPENTIYSHARVSKDTQPAEFKIYDEISQPKVAPTQNESAKTIYSTVQRSDEMKKTDTLGGKPPKTSGYDMVI